MLESTANAAPAGWYADPSGLPQLRWWDSQAWSEHVHQPVLQEQEASRTATAVLERTEVVVPAGTVEATGLHDYASEHATVGWKPAIETTQAAPEMREPSITAVAHAQLKASEPRLMRAHTKSVWMLAFMPVIQAALVVGVFFLLDNADNFRVVLGVVVVVPCLLSIALAGLDHRALRNAGHYSTAHWGWAMLSPLLYLLIRTVRVHRLARRGSAPLWTWITFTIAQAGAAVFFATTVVSILTSLFSVEVAHTVEESVALQGVTLDVECPANAPLTLGSEFQCAATHDTGQVYFVNVHVDDVLGGFTWQMTDDGDEAFASH